MTPEQRRAGIVQTMDALIEAVQAGDDEQSVAIGGLVLDMHLRDLDRDALNLMVAACVAMVVGANGEAERRGVTG